MGVIRKLDYLDAEYVFIRLEEAIETLRSIKMDDVYPMGYRSSWPDMVQTFFDAYGYTEEDMPRATPSSKRVDEMDEALLWFNHVKDRRHAKALFACAMGVRPQKIARSLKKDRATIRRWKGYALDNIVSKENLL
ncbi:DUF6362 family protein [Curvivirga aplysinae]|uniref:DUF6362 family protein n=1 Tax=Curvivirga aplysinae TaxID=2529852 RepID=UPI0012BD1095|nr:DUF6362 family protein [Curvivirga aplysinae]MTI10202.1 helix-turn-helix domain-containing protein [Curvivirga aplysinae]